MLTTGGLRALFLFVNLLGVLSYNCPAGFDCVSQQICTNEILPCARGLYCPGEKVVAANLCQRGHFCTTPNTTEDCTTDHFCPTFTIEPLPCLLGSFCGKEGTRKDLWFLLIAIEVVLFIIGIIAWCIWAKRSNPGKEKAASSVKIKIANDTERPPKIDVSITSIGVVITHKKAKRELLSSATGEFLSGRLAAIMGPSGAGKTTLLNVMSGRIKHTSGNLYINGTKDDIEKYDKLVGFVPQDDTMLRMLTVRQVLDHSARMRLPATMTWAEKRDVVDNVIDMLGLSRVQNSRIGDEVTRGISGGERKRVNIGIELVAKPSLLFLDEPTTGLDSASAKDVVSCLHDIAKMGITVVAVLHQPRYEILTLCDDLLLLGKGGKTAYMGPLGDALPYFEAIGYKCPHNLNPADFFIDITSGRLPIDPNASSASLASPAQPVPPASPPAPENLSPPLTPNAAARPTREPSAAHMPAPPTLLRNSVQLDPALSRSVPALPVASRELAASLSAKSGSLGYSSGPWSQAAMSLLSAQPEPISTPPASPAPASPASPASASSRLLPSPLAQRTDSQEIDPSQLTARWVSRARAMSEAIETTVTSRNSQGASLSPVDKKSNGPSTGFFAQFSLLFYRCLLQQYQDIRTTLVELVYQFLPGLALGYATDFEFYTPPIPEMLVSLCPAIVRGKCETDAVGRNVEEIIFYMTMVASAAAAATATSRFGLERANFKRERRSGINIYAYFLAKNVYDLIDVMRCVVLFIGTFFILGGAAGRLGDWFAVMFMMMFAAYGMGYFISMTSKYDKAVVTSVVCCIMWSVTSGLSPTLDQVKNWNVMQVFWWISYARWGGEALNLTLVTDYPQLKDRIDFSLRSQGYDPNGFALDMGMLLAIGIAWRILAFIGLIGIRRTFGRFFRKKNKAITVKRI